MAKMMKAIKLFLDWQPREGYELGSRDVKEKRAQEGNKIWQNPRVEIVTVPVPKIESTEVLIKVRACGICGSDVLMSWPDDQGYTRYPYIMGNLETPGQIIIGHEFSGQIVEMGRAVKDFQKKIGKEAFKVGTPVTAQCVVNCGICEMCKEGKFDSCQMNEERGFSIDGAMAEYLKVEFRHLYSLEGLKEKYPGKELFLAGALVEPLAGVYKALIEAGKGLKPGDNVVVIGGGPIGLSAVALAKAIGAAKVILFELSVSRRRLGKKMGADHALDPIKVNFQKTILELTDGVGAKVYFEAAGIGPRIWPEIDYLFRTGEPESKFILMGHGPGTMEISHETFIGGYNVLVGSHGHSGIWRNVIRMVAAGLIDPRKMITRKITLEEVPKWLEVLRTNKEEGKAVIDYETLL